MGLMTRVFNVMLGKATDAVDSLEDNSTLAKQALGEMEKNFVNMKLAVSDLEAKVLTLEFQKSQLQSEVKDSDKKIDEETNKYVSLSEKEEQDKQRLIVNAYIERHKKLSDKYDALQKTYDAQNSELQSLKEELRDLSDQLESAKFSTSQVETNDTLNKARGKVGGTKGFDQAKETIDKLSNKVNEQSMAQKSFKNLGKSESDLLIEDHEKQAKKVDVNDEFSKRLEKANQSKSSSVG